MIPAETELWSKVDLALETGCVDKAVWDRQPPYWISELYEALVERSLPVAGPPQDIILPGGVRIRPEG